ERPARATAVVRELDLAGEVVVEDVARLLALDAAVVDPLREADEVAGEPVAADVCHLPHGLLLDLLGKCLEERTSVARAARVVLAVRADEEELVDRVAGGREVEPP